MRPGRPRTAISAFLLAFIIGIAAWYGLTQWRAGALARRAEAPAPVEPPAGAAPVVAQEAAAPVPYVRLGPVQGIRGYANAKRVTLRESPRAGAPVVAKLRTVDYDRAEILDSTSDFLRVRFAAGEGNRERDYEGWAAWGEVVAFYSAIVLDAATGEVLTRLALPEGGYEGTPSFSPDGERAIFYGRASSACEVSTSDYKLKSCLLMPGWASISAAFYGPKDGRLYAAIGKMNASTFDSYRSHLSVLRVSESGEAEDATPPAWSGDATGLSISPDGRTGFIMHKTDDKRHMSSVDVFDVETLRVRNTLTLAGPSPFVWPGQVVVNRDGSELYTTEVDDEGRQKIALIDTRTGQRLRDFIVPLKAGNWEGLTPNSVVGDALFSRTSTEKGEAVFEQGMWIDVKGTSAAAPGMTRAVEAAGSRFGTDENGTRLFKLDQKNRVLKRFNISRPELRLAPGMIGEMGVYNLAASPDGKRVIIFFGPVDNC